MYMGIEKYYTPSIEEFHIGFEFEIKDMSVNDGWLKMSHDYLTVDPLYICFEKNSEGEIIKEYVNDAVRVKYLDSADIEECGWVLKSEGNVIVFKRNEPIDPNESEEFLRYWHLNLHEDGTVVIHNNGFYDSEVIIFYGKIKNKSELKRLMKQLGVWE